jgi:predicted dehydrogenase
VTALVTLLGPVRSVRGVARTLVPERVVRATGRRFPAEVPTHVTGVLEFEQGAVVTVVMSWDGWATELPCMEIYGEEATLSVPDPNEFAGPVRLRGPEHAAWQDVPLVHGAQLERGTGVAELAHAVYTGRPHRASAELALHVLEVLTALGGEDAGERLMTTSAARPAPFRPAMPSHAGVA